MKSDSELHQSVVDVFDKFGGLLSVKVLRDWMGRPYAFVQYAEEQNAQTAFALARDAIIHGRTIRIEHAKVNRTLFIAKLDRSLSSVDLRDMMSDLGPIEELTILQNHETGENRGCGFLKFKFREDAMNAVHVLRSRFQWVVEWASNLERNSHAMVDQTSVFVGQLNQYEVTEDLLAARFSQYGAIDEIELIKKTPATRHHAVSTNGGITRMAFAFVKFSDAASAKAAIEQENGKVWLDRAIRVQYREIPDAVQSYSATAKHPFAKPAPTRRDSRQYRHSLQPADTAFAGYPSMNHQGPFPVPQPPVMNMDSMYPMICAEGNVYPMMYPPQFYDGGANASFYPWASLQQAHSSAWIPLYQSYNDFGDVTQHTSSPTEI